MPVIAMYTKSDGAIWFFVFIVGVFFLQAGVKARKLEKSRCAGNLSISMAICAFAALVLAMFVYVSKVDRTWVRIVSTIQLIIAGIWLAIFLIMLFFGYFKQLKSPQCGAGEDSQNGELK
ncbi:MAG: hypothetical protein EXS35_15960 [Pedosphaera sp.]|nr:hypothetical protein [Pedosphaera sp.]